MPKNKLKLQKIFGLAISDCNGTPNKIKSNKCNNNAIFLIGTIDGEEWRGFPVTNRHRIVIQSVGFYYYSSCLDDCLCVNKTTNFTLVRICFDITSCKNHLQYSVFSSFFFVFAQFERINPLCWKTNLNYLNINISLGGMNFLCNAILRIFYRISLNK